MANFLVARGTLTAYNGLGTKNPDTVYYIKSTDSGAYDRIYLGEALISDATSFVDASISGNIITLTRANGTTAKTIDLTTALNALKSSIVGDAAADYNTLGKLEDKLLVVLDLEKLFTTDEEEEETASAES